MDSRSGEFVSSELMKMLDGENKERIIGKPTLAEEEVVEIKGVKFRVHTMLTRGRVMLKMLNEEEIRNLKGD